MCSCGGRTFRDRGDVHRRQVRSTAPLRRRRVRASMLQLLAGRRCTDCGTADVLVLEFDHVGEQRADMASLVRQTASERRLMEEMAHCEVV